tara:strand:+ start:42135 stop:43208 length:1074 start_codon:yes stop_codon:yes gene_type:complete
MAITDSQKVDLLWKKVGFGKTKTDSNANKKAPNEGTSSDFIIKVDQIWAQSASVTSVIPTANSSIATVYSDALGKAHKLSEDATSSDNRTWKTNLTNWIAPSFGATYQVKIYAAGASESTPQTNGTQLYETGSGSDDQWYFDYQSGVLHFIGNNLPAEIGTSTANVIYAAGARYIGATGIGSDASGASATYRKANMTAVFSDTTINDGDIIEVNDIGDGEYGVYIAKQDAPTATGHLTLISTQDSSGSDAQTLSASVTYDSASSTALGNLSSSSKPMQVMVNVTTAFDGTSTLTVGDDNANSRLMSTTYVDLSETGVYVTNPSYVYTNALDADNTLKVYSTQGTSTQGAATVYVTYA